MKDAEIRDIADRILRAELGRFGYERAEVHSGFDHSDEPAIFVDAILSADAPPLPGNAIIDAHFALSQALLAGGEDRFPYLRTKRLGDELPEDVILRPFRSRT